ncbi:MAG: DUF2231 domain-containing protein [Deltaproteobacteria bacterium]
MDIERGRWSAIKELSPEELAQYNGQDGKPVYIAHGDKVVDVTASKLWKDGLHMKRHHAGKDLTTDIQAAPHGVEVLARYPQVGVFKPDRAPERQLPASLVWLLSRFPMLRRHPHPMVIHFPIVFMISTAGFTVLYLLTRYEGFDTTAFHCLGGGLLFTPIAILTGFYTWWLNYMAKPNRPVNIKMRFSVLLLAVQIAAFSWRLFVPDILTRLGQITIPYVMLVLSLAGIVTVIGWYGAMLTFPIERD